MKDVLARLKKVRETLEQRKQERARLEGQRDALLKRLHDEFGLDSVEEATAEAERMETELATAEKDIRERVDKLEGMVDDANAEG